MAGLLRLGDFAFQPTGPSYESLQESYSYKWTEQEVLQSPNKQYWGGKQQQTLTIQGSLYPDLILPQYTEGFVTGVITNFNAIAALRNSFKKLDAMASSGNSYVLVDSTGTNYGSYVITGHTIDKSNFWNDAVARKNAFTLQLRRDLSEDPDEGNLNKFSDIIDLTIIKVRDLFN
jgi:phage protein U